MAERRANAELPYQCDFRRITMATLSVLEEFMQHVSPEPNSGCWLWAGAVDTGGYGAVKWNGRFTTAHRKSYELHIGPIPEGLYLDHLCRVRCCVNPKHVEPVTNSENCKRGKSGEFNRSKSHCPSGHEYTPENTYHSVRRNGWKRRQCATCVKDRQKRLRACPRSARSSDCPSPVPAYQRATRQSA